MHLRRLRIENFRAITKLDLALNSGANILIGPNAVGKTTILEAVRLCKAILSPRTQNESRTILVQLGISPANIPQVQNFAAIAGDITKPIVITCDYELRPSEVDLLPKIIPELKRLIIAAQTGISPETGQVALIQFLSSPAGAAMRQQVDKFVEDNLARLRESQSCTLGLAIDLGEQNISGSDLFGQTLFSSLETRLSPFKTPFSYFPADRALPQGDVPIQLGSVDAQQQLESHNSQPAIKYQRLKSTIFAAFVESEISREKLSKTFQRIFTVLLKDRELVDFSINQHGQASIRVRDTRSGKVFDIDSMSSGEKGLILTFLTLGRSVEQGGIVLIDEPELHLNPAVCKDLLNFLSEEYLSPLDIQAIICTHSPEILGAAMKMEHATVFHLRQGGSASLIRRQDQSEVATALKLLGTSEVEEMLYEAVVFVEGPDDVDLLETAFPASLPRIKFRDLAGRGEVEKLIHKLQHAEREGNKEGISYFVFDHDNRATALASTAKVKVEQWGRYCLENYLLDQHTLYDVLKREFSTTKTPTDLGSAIQLFERIAKRQLKALVVEQVFNSLNYENPGLRPAERNLADFTASADALFRRLERIRNQVTLLDESTWKSQFVSQCEALLSTKEQEWSSSWPAQCSGKQFFKDLYQECGLGVRPIVLKRRLLQENKYSNDGAGTESWKLLKSSFNGLFEK